jgi:streptomycin 6-kinase
LICNPDLPTANDPQRFKKQIEVVAQAAGLERQRLLQWVLAFAGLSAAWFLEDKDELAAQGQLQAAELAAFMLIG